MNHAAPQSRALRSVNATTMRRRGAAVQTTALVAGLQCSGRLRLPARGIEGRVRIIEYLQAAVLATVRGLAAR
jgi:hypothetical protein